MTNSPKVLAGIKKTVDEIEKMSPEEVEASIEKYAKENPERVEFFHEIFGDITFEEFLNNGDIK